MPIILPASMASEIEKPHGAAPMLWMVEIELAKMYRSGATIVPAVVARLTSWQDEIDWPVDDPVPKTWTPYGFTLTPIKQDGEGNLPQLDLTIDNSTRLLMRHLHDGSGLEGNACRLYLVSAAGLAIAYPNHERIELALQIAEANANDEAIQLRLERANFFERTSPTDRYNAATCRWASTFGGPECGYVLNEVAAYSTCTGTLDACVLRGLDHLARGVPVVHPKRFGGFPGIAR